MDWRYALLSRIVACLVVLGLAAQRLPHAAAHGFSNDVPAITATGGDAVPGDLSRFYADLTRSICSKPSGDEGDAQGGSNHCDLCCPAPNSVVLATSGHVHAPWPVEVSANLAPPREISTNSRRPLSDGPSRAPPLQA